MNTQRETEAVKRLDASGELPDQPPNYDESPEAVEVRAEMDRLVAAEVARDDW